MKTFALWLFGGVIAASAWGCASVPSQPPEVFDEYIRAYADGDAERLWALSTPKARRDARQLKAELMRHLTHSDPVMRVKIEGVFGITADDIAHLAGYDFYRWAVLAIRRRLGPGYVRKTVSGWVRVTVEPAGDGAVRVLYRERNGRINKLLLRKTKKAWRVAESPFVQFLKYLQSQRLPVRPKTPKTD